jgi:DNA-binding transcriptional LysR family regulator
MVAGDVPNVHLRQLVYLREVERQGTVTRAADVLGVSQPALSQSLADLERRLGVALFEPAGRGRRLTDDGHEVLAFAERVLAETSTLQERLSARVRGEGGSLRVGMIDAASLYVLPAVIQRYRRSHPDVDLSLHVETSTELVRRLRAFDLDLVFVVGPPDEDLHADEVSREALYLYAPPGQHPDALDADADWVLYPEGSRTRAVINEGLARLGIRARVTLESHNPEVLRQMVALGLGWSVLPLTVAEDEGALGGGRGPQVAERALVGLRRSADNPRAEAFLQLALEVRSSQRAEGRRVTGDAGGGEGAQADESQSKSSPPARRATWRGDEARPARRGRPRRSDA